VFHPAIDNQERDAHAFVLKGLMSVTSPKPQTMTPNLAMGRRRI